MTMGMEDRGDGGMHTHRQPQAGGVGEGVREGEEGGCDSRVRLGGAGSYLEVRLGQWQQENGLGHGWVAGLEDGRQEGRSLSLQDIRETVWLPWLPTARDGPHHLAGLGGGALGL